MTKAAGDIDGLLFRSHYWADSWARAEFKSFLMSIHGLDLTPWEERGYWDEQYAPFSLFEGSRIISSVCLYSMDLTVAGRRCRWAQFSGVGTLPSYRGRGLNRWLTRKAIDWASPTHDGFFLFANQGALGFYEKCGFVPVVERAPILRVCNPGSRTGMRKLDVGDKSDLDLIYERACERSPVSNVLGVRNPKLLMFHVLTALRECAYYIANLDLVVFFKIDNDRLYLFDVVGHDVPPFAELHPYLADQPHSEAIFYFTPDKMDIAATSTEPLLDSNAHILPPLSLPRSDSLFPFVAHA